MIHDITFLPNSIYLILGILIMLFGLLSSFAYGGHDSGTFDGACSLLLGIALITLSISAFDEDVVCPIWVFIPLAFFIFCIVFITYSHETGIEYMSKISKRITGISYILLLPTAFTVFFGLYTVLY